MPLGNHSGRITLFSSIAPETPRYIDVKLAVTDPTSAAPGTLGVFEAPPNNGVGLSGAVPLGGWVVSSIGLRRVQYLSRRGCGRISRRDLRWRRDSCSRCAARRRRSLWPAGSHARRLGIHGVVERAAQPGNGTFTFSSYAEDILGTRVRVGLRRTMTFDNNNSPFPFGTIDVPSQGGSVSGMSAPIQGWVLAQPGKSIPF